MKIRLLRFCKKRLRIDSSQLLCKKWAIRFRSVLLPTSKMPCVWKKPSRNEASMLITSVMSRDSTRSACNHATYKPARTEAEQLQSQGLIDKFFIVFPEDYAAARINKSGKGDLRNELVKTARRFIGIPYRWGGTTAENGFDCSGLTMVSYRLNGLNLPRVSRNQFKAGKWVSKSKLRPGDLVFFATKGGTRVTHVGMYVGDGNFIHAPRTGKNVRIEKMSNSFFAKTYMGGRTYL